MRNIEDEWLDSEKMTDSRLLAIFPVATATAMATAEGKGWQVPNPELLTASQARTHRRVLGGDSDPDHELA